MHAVKQTESTFSISELLAKRISGREYNAEKQIPHNVLLRLLEAGRWSPSCYGDQPWRFIVFDRYQDRESWQHALSLVHEKNRSWAQHAPVLILVAAATNFSHNQKPNDYAAYDTGAAMMSLSVQATEEGLMVHQMGGFDKAAAHTEFQLPSDVNALAMVAVGYPADPSILDTDNTQKDGRTRKPLAQTFFMGRWNRGIE
jgi:nitroreductase